MNGDSPTTLPKDLLSVQETPGMSAPLPWRVFYMNDCEWWVARSLEEAKVDAAKAWGCSVATAEADGMYDDPYELCDAELERLKFVVDRELPEKQWKRITFREELERRVAVGMMQPELFACTEY